MLSSVGLLLVLLGVISAQSVYFGWAQRPDPLPAAWFGVSNPNAGNAIYGFSAELASVTTGSKQGAMAAIVGAPTRNNDSSGPATGTITILMNCYSYLTVLQESNSRCSDSMELEDQWFTMVEPEPLPYGNLFNLLGETPDSSKINYFMGWTSALEFIQDGQEGAVACGFGRWGLTAEGRIVCYHNPYNSGGKWSLVNMTSSAGVGQFMNPTDFAYNISGAPQGLRLGESMTIDPLTGTLAVGISRYLNKHGRVYLYPAKGGNVANGYTSLAADGSFFIDPEDAGVAAGLASLGFGYSLSFGTNELFVGCPGRDLQQGSVFIFAKVDGTFIQEVKADDAAGGMQFGISLDASLDSEKHFIVGANRLDLASDTGLEFAAGSAYVFSLDPATNTSWKLQANLKTNICSNDVCLLNGGDEMGRKVAISADARYAIASAHNADGLDPTDTRTGTIYVFNRDYSASQDDPVYYALVSTRRNGDAERGSVFSRSLSLASLPNSDATDTNYYILAGAPGSNLLDPTGADTTGMAYFFQGVTQRIDGGTTGETSAGSGSSSGGDNSSPASELSSFLF